MTEVVRDTDVMPVDPLQNLPLALMGRPLVLNGHASSAVGPPSGGASGLGWGGAAGAGGSSLSAAAAAAAAAAALGRLDADQTQEDQQLLQDLARALDSKERLLTRLRTMNATAEGNAHIDAATGRPSQDFQQEYTGVLHQLQVRAHTLDTCACDAGACCSECQQEEAEGSAVRLRGWGDRQGGLPHQVRGMHSAKVTPTALFHAPSSLLTLCCHLLLPPQLLFPSPGGQH